MRFVSPAVELGHIGADTDVPAGDLRARGFGYMFGQYKTPQRVHWCIHRQGYTLRRIAHPSRPLASARFIMSANAWHFGDDTN